MTKIITEHRCLMCGADIPEEKKRSSYCSDLCRNRANYWLRMKWEPKFIYQKECAFCWQPFFTRSWYHACCSAKCQRQYHNRMCALNHRQIMATKKEDSSGAKREPPLPEALCWSCCHTARDCVWRSTDGKQQVEGSRLLVLKRAVSGRFSGVTRRVVECPLYVQEVE